jgi:hypothetical protein
MQHGFVTGYDPRRGVLISTLAYEYPRGFHVNEHAHGSDQLIYAIRGVMHVIVPARKHFAVGEVE